MPKPYHWLNLVGVVLVEEACTSASLVVEMTVPDCVRPRMVPEWVPAPVVVMVRRWR